jgi:flavin-dependent dehydrogenase
MSADTDILILGGGPAGCSTALMLLQLCPALRVTVAEAADNSVVRPGEALDARALPLLQQLGIGAAFQAQNHLQSQGIRSYWGQNQVTERHQLYNYTGAGWQVNRSQLHTWLRQCVQAKGGMVQQGTFTRQAVWEQEHWTINLTNEQAISTTLRCRMVIDATGRKATFARHCGATIRHTDHLCGVQRFFTLPRQTAATDSFVQIEAMPDGWWYSALLPDRRWAVTWFSDSDLIRQGQLHEPSDWMQALSKAQHTHARVQDAIPDDTPVHVFNAMSQHLSQAAGTGWIATGDAACAFDPLSGQGMVKAFRSGIWAAFAALDYLNGKKAAIEKYNYIANSDFSGYIKSHAANYATEQRWQDRQFWKRRIYPNNTNLT